VFRAKSSTHSIDGWQRQFAALIVDTDPPVTDFEHAALSKFFERMPLIALVQYLGYDGRNGLRAPNLDRKLGNGVGVTAMAEFLVAFVPQRLNRGNLGFRDVPGSSDLAVMGRKDTDLDVFLLYKERVRIER
jgi:hypothetical protein